MGKLRDSMSPEEYDRLAAAFEHAIAHPAPQWVFWAWDACNEIVVFAEMDSEHIDRVMVAALDAEPQGQEAVECAATQELRTILIELGRDRWHAE
jgi:hypothetical protein